MTLFISITVFSGTDSVSQNILEYFPHSISMWEYIHEYSMEYCQSYNNVMDLNNVMMHSRLHGWANQCGVVSCLLKLKIGHPTVNHLLLHFEHLWRRAISLSGANTTFTLGENIIKLISSMYIFFFGQIDYEISIIGPELASIQFMHCEYTIYFHSWGVKVEFIGIVALKGHNQRLRMKDTFGGEPTNVTNHEVIFPRCT
jgi:hypothetical protein